MDIVLVGEKIDVRERHVYGRLNDSKELYSKVSKSRRKIQIEGMNLKFYTIKEVDLMRGKIQ